MLNDGEGSFSDTGQRLGSAITADIGLGDLDGDGDLDALTGGWDEPSRVWFNDGTGVFNDSGNKLSPAETHIHAISLGDVDGDEDLDAFLAIASGDPHEVWLNNGDGSFVNSDQDLRGPLGHAVTLADLDGDGDLDAFTAHGDRHRGTENRVWLNDGTGQFSDSGLRLGDTYSFGVALGDLDGDGDLDAFVANSELWGTHEGGLPNEVWINESSTIPSQAPQTRTRASDGMAMVRVLGGTFIMGSTTSELEVAWVLCDEYPDDYGKCKQAPFDDEAPSHSVSLDSFWLDRTEVNNAQFALCVADGVCHQSKLANNAAYNGPDLPVAGIPWQDAADYCAWVGGRLPTEAEWEYAARGAGGSIFPWGDEFDCAGGNFWDDGTGCEDGYAEPAPVGSFPDGASWCGVLDMAGNVWEWVANVYAPYSAKGQDNPVGAPSGDERILRGGSWGYLPAFSRGAYRYPVPPTADYLAVGFRCATDQ
jgi:formylglycine-generating enzyme required for sulfatase activity